MCNDVRIILMTNYWEGLAQSVAWFVVLILMLLLMMGLGLWPVSRAHQWIVGLVWFCTLVGLASRDSIKIHCTPDEALEKIQPIQRLKGG